MAKFTAAIALLLLPVVFAQELPVPDVPLSALSRDSPVKFVKPSLSPTQGNSTNYVGASNGTIVNGPVVPGKMFDRIITIMLENTDYDVAAGSETFKKLASKGILFSDYAITHPSMPNYIAAVSGSTQGSIFDDTRAHEFQRAPIDVKTVVDLLEDKEVSWGVYMENMPSVGFTDVDYSSHNYHEEGGADYAYYVRRHNGLMNFESIVQNPARLERMRNFNNFAEDLQNDALPQWTWITPNINNDAHDTDIDYVSEWLEYFLKPLLEDERFNNNRTFVQLTWDESAIGPHDINHIYFLGLGQIVPEALHGSEDSNYYNHYSALTTVEENWDLGSLGEGDVNADVYEFLAKGLDHENTNEEPLVTGLGPGIEPGSATL